MMETFSDVLWMSLLLLFALMFFDHEKKQNIRIANRERDYRVAEYMVYEYRKAIKKLCDQLDLAKSEYSFKEKELSLLKQKYELLEAMVPVTNKQRKAGL